MTVTVTNNTEKTVKKIKVLGRTFYGRCNLMLFPRGHSDKPPASPTSLGLPTVAVIIDSRTLGREGP